MRAVVVVLGLSALAALSGCAESEQKRYRVSGKVTFDGKPIPHGEVLITPDGSRQNSGAQGIATIRDGRFDTSAGDGKGYGGGPAVVRVTGFDREGGKLLCEEELRVDLPQGDAERDLDVPKTKDKPKGGATPDI